VHNKHIIKHRLLDHAKQTSINKGILEVGGSNVTKCVFVYNIHCVSKKGPTLKRYSSKLYASILMIFGRNIQKSLE